MENEKFNLLFDVLKFIEQEDLRNSATESIVVGIIDAFDKDFTQEQKDTILKEFLRYEKMRRSRTEAKEFEKKLREEEFAEKTPGRLRFWDEERFF